MLFFFCSASCQNKAIKQKTALRCLYDQPPIAQAALRAVADEQAFASFKRDPFYALFYQKHSYEEGLEFLQKIQEHFPLLLSRFEDFQASDCIGDPYRYDYGKYGLFSPSTLYHIYSAAQIQEKMGSLSDCHIIQIGAGYGHLCKMLHELSGWKSYTLVDLPEHLALAEKVLKIEGITGVRFLTPEALETNVTYDLVVSQEAFSEFSRPFQKLFIDRVILHARAGYLQGHLFPKYFGVEPFSFSELTSFFNQKTPLPTVEIDEIIPERENYFIYWTDSMPKRENDLVFESSPLTYSNMTLFPRFGIICKNR